MCIPPPHAVFTRSKKNSVPNTNKKKENPSEKRKKKSLGERLSISNFRQNIVKEGDMKKSKNNNSLKLCGMTYSEYLEFLENELEKYVPLVLSQLIITFIPRARIIDERTAVRHVHWVNMQIFSPCVFVSARAGTLFCETVQFFCFFFALSRKK